jgi:hypothetical protein
MGLVWLRYFFSARFSHREDAQTRRHVKCIGNLQLWLRVRWSVLRKRGRKSILAKYLLELGFKRDQPY